MRAPFADRHVDFWEWVEAITPNERPRPFVAIWPRGGAKSTSAELAAVRMGAKNARRYIWYISGTQDKADKHVETIGSMLESDTVARLHPGLSERMVSKYGHSKGWRRSRLRTASGLTVDALGLDVGSRGAKVEDQRPDMMIFDDVDEKHDTLATVTKKIEIITTSLLPAGSNDLAVMFIQNLIHDESVAARLVDGRADFLADRIVSGPFPALEGLTYEQQKGRFVISGGEPTWKGQDREVCQSQVDTWGLTAFLQEAQHDVQRTGGIWDHIEFQHITFDEVPELVRGCVWVDPAVTSTDQSDSNGIQADALGIDGKVYRFYSWEAIEPPEAVIKRAILKALEFGFGSVGIETDQGGDTWRSVYSKACEAVRANYEQYKDADMPQFVSDKAGAGHGPKIERNARMLADYERGRVVHVVGTHATLEKSLRRFPNKPLDLADAAYWGWQGLSKPFGASLIGFA